MIRRLIIAAIAAAAVTLGLSALPGLAATHHPAAKALTSAASPSIGFQASAGGSTAGWSDPGNRFQVALHVVHFKPVSCPYTGCGFAMISLAGTGSSLTGQTEPSFAADIYGSGTPRMELVPNIGADSILNDVTGYPHSSGLCPSSPGVCWDLGTGGLSAHASWTEVQVYMNEHGGLARAYIVADESMAAPYTTDVTLLTWNGTHLIAPPSALSAKDCGGNLAHRVWQVGDHTGGRDVFFTAFSLLRGGRWFRDGTGTVKAGRDVVLVTHRGTTLSLRWRDGYGHAVSRQFPAVVQSCP